MSWNLNTLPFGGENKHPLLIIWQGDWVIEESTVWEFLHCEKTNCTYHAWTSLKLTARTWKWMIGRRSFPFGIRFIFRGELLVLGRVTGKCWLYNPWLDGVWRVWGLVHTHLKFNTALKKLPSQKESSHRSLSTIIFQWLSETLGVYWANYTWYRLLLKLGWSSLCEVWWSRVKS